LYFLRAVRAAAPNLLFQGAATSFGTILASHTSPPRSPRGGIWLKLRGVLTMTNDVIAAQWPRLKGLLRRRWARLTDEDLARTDGNSVYLAGLIEHHYGMAREVADRQVRDFGRHIERRIKAASQSQPTRTSPDQHRPI
jgi:uncharacterized protein YjbJ (UPF0337 family)